MRRRMRGYSHDDQYRSNDRIGHRRGSDLRINSFPLQNHSKAHKINGEKEQRQSAAELGIESSIEKRRGAHVPIRSNHIGTFILYSIILGRTSAFSKSIRQYVHQFLRQLEQRSQSSALSSIRIGFSQTLILENQFCSTSESNPLKKVTKYKY